VVGPNGAGKSTLLKGVTGILSPIEGRIEFGSISREDVAYLPQKSDIDLTFPMRVRDLVAMGLWKEIGAFGKLRRQHRARVDEAIDAVGLTGLEKRSIGTLSGGQVQRALFARLILQDAKMVLLDEPFSAIDARTMSDLIAVIQKWHTDDLGRPDRALCRVRLYEAGPAGLFGDYPWVDACGRVPHAA